MVFSLLAQLAGESEGFEGWIGGFAFLFRSVQEREFSPVFCMFKQLFHCRKCFEFKKPYTPYFMQLRIALLTSFFFSAVGVGIIKLITVHGKSISLFC